MSSSGWLLWTGRARRLPSLRSIDALAALFRHGGEPPDGSSIE